MLRFLGQARGYLLGSSGYRRLKLGLNVLLVLILAVRWLSIDPYHNQLLIC